ncbi:NACHT domain-containing protein [Streptomyces sp. NPDC059785]|uniref:NACHT domain-containing protein n=1 Tax=Streptomyces sp. NPDC059785 TaxID=3346945 RepID=UPI00365FD0FD
MEPAAIGARLASSVVAPLIKKLFVAEGPGAGLVDNPVRVSRLLSFTGEKRTLSETDLHKIARELVARAAQSTGVAEQLPAYERRAVAHAVADSLRAMDSIDMEDVQAVQLGHMAFAQHLRAQSRSATLGLSNDAVLLYVSVLDTACLHIVHFFTQRSTFVARTLVEQSRRIEELSIKIDTLIARTPSPADAPFEERYAQYIASKHGKLTIFGLDLAESPGIWPLDTAYLSLDAVGDTTHLPADQILAGRHRVLLRGVAGSGKTTLIQWLAVSTAQKNLDERLLYLYGLVPFVLPLRTLTRGGAKLPTPDEFLSEVSCPIAALQPAGWFDRVLRSGRGLILVDGIDEIPESERQGARRWLQDLVATYPRNRWLVTSRPSAVRENWLTGDDFAELDLAAMSRDNIAAFVERWHKAAGIGDQYAQDLMRAIRAKQDLARLATNPLMCALICALHQDRRGYLPDGRKEIYDAALSMLLSRRDRERGIHKPGAIRIGEAHLVQLIQKLAYWMIRNGRSEMDRGDAVRLLDHALPTMPKVAEQGSPEEIYRHLVVRSGLLREPTAGAMDFIHRTFQDYLGARAAVEGLDFDFLIAHAHLDQWEDVIRMSVAHARFMERTRLLTGLVARGDASEKEGRRLHLLAAACLEHATELDPDVRDEVQRRAAALIPPQSAEQARALAEVGPVVLDLLPGPADIPPDSPDRAYFTVLTATRIATDAAIPVLALYRDEPDLRIRTELARVWNRFDCDRYGEEVIAHLSPEFLYFPVSNTRELRVLRRFGGRPRLKISGSFSPEEFLRVCDRESPHDLWVEVDPGGTWEWLSAFPNLRTVYFEVPVSTAETVPRSVRVVGEPIAPPTTSGTAAESWDDVDSLGT